MPWTTAPPTYRSIPSLSLSASPSESALATSLRLRAVSCLPQRGQGETSAVKWWWRDPWKQRLDPDAVRRAVAPLARESLSRAETQHPSACGRACPPARSCQAPPALRTLGVRGPCCSRPNLIAAKSSRRVLANFFRAHVLTKQPGSLSEPGMERRA